MPQNEISLQSSACYVHCPYEDGTITGLTDQFCPHIKKTQNPNTKLNIPETRFILDISPASLAPVTKSSQLPKPWNVVGTRDTKVNQMLNRNTPGILGFDFPSLLVTRCIECFSAGIYVDSPLWSYFF